MSSPPNRQAGAATGPCAPSPAQQTPLGAKATTGPMGSSSGPGEQGEFAAPRHAHDSDPAGVHVGPPEQPVSCPADDLDVDADQGFGKAWDTEVGDRQRGDAV
jgi:hypothetical protein